MVPALQVSLDPGVFFFEKAGSAKVAHTFTSGRAKSCIHIAVSCAARPLLMRDTMQRTLRQSRP
jgi:hypothetical protein